MPRVFPHRALAVDGAGRGICTLPAAWVIAVFDADGLPARCVEYRPILHDEALDDVGYAEAAWRLAPYRPD